MTANIRICFLQRIPVMGSLDEEFMREALAEFLRHLGLEKNSSAHTVAPWIVPNLPYDTARDLAAVVSLGRNSNVLLVPPGRGWKTAQDLVAAAKAKPGSITYGSAGVGTATHMSAERFRLSAGFEATHVPYKGGP